MNRKVWSDWLRQFSGNLTVKGRVWKVLPEDSGGLEGSRGAVVQQTGEQVVLLVQKLAKKRSCCQIRVMYKYFSVRKKNKMCD